MQRFGTKALMAAMVVAATSLVLRAEENTHHIATSEIVGQNLLNQNDEKLGSIDDLILDREGTVLYAVLGHGGVLGIGESHLAVPWSAVTKVFTLSGDERKVKLSIKGFSSKEIEKAPMLEKEDYAELTDNDWVARNAKFFDADAPSTSNERDAYRLASQMLKGQVNGAEEKEVAEVESLVLDPEFKKLQYIVIDHETTITDDKLVVVPVAAMKITKNEDGFLLKVDASKKTLDGAPRITDGKFQELDNSDLQDRIKKTFPERD